jgi:hypothetical protein
VPPSRDKQEAVAARRARALQMRAAGVTYQAIADELGYRGKGAAHQDITRALAARKEMLDTQATLFVTLEMERLDLLEQAVQSVLRQASREAERSLMLRAADRLLRIAERRAKLLGLDAGPADSTAGEASPLDELRARRERRFTGG